MQMREETRMQATLHFEIEKHIDSCDRPYYKMLITMSETITKTVRLSPSEFELLKFQLPEIAKALN